MKSVTSSARIAFFGPASTFSISRQDGKLHTFHVHRSQSSHAVDGPDQILRTGNQAVILDRRQRQMALPQQGT